MKIDKKDEKNNEIWTIESGHSITDRKQVKVIRDESKIWTKESEDNNKVFATSNKVQYMLRNGYQLNITTNMQKSECTAFTSLKYGDNPLNEAEEVDTSVLLSTTSSIKDYLLQSYGTTIIIVFNGSSNKFEGWAVKELTKGPYCEHVKDEVIEKTRVESYSFNDCIKKLENKLLSINLKISSCNNLNSYYNKEQKGSGNMEQVKEEIPSDYFLRMFEQETYNRTRKICSSKQEDEDDFYLLTDEEQLQVFVSSFYDILVKYLLLTDNKEITARSEKPIELFDLILCINEDNPYRKSLLKSVQHIIVRYLEILGKGYPTIMFSNDDEKEKSFRVVYDRRQRINTFDSTNMSLEEQTDIMVRVLKNTMEDKIELMPSVRYITRTDI